MKTTPSRAIKLECKYCKNGNKFECESEICQLNRKDIPSLKRIKEHCLDCVGNRDEVIKCSGNVFNSSTGRCHLHPFRLGKNPYLKGKGNPNLIKLGEKYRFVSKRSVINEQKNGLNCNVNRLSHVLTSKL